MIDNKKYKEASLWARGKENYKKFYDINLKRSTNIKTFAFGFIISLIILLPVAIIIYQFLAIYGYFSNAFGIYIFIVWLCLMLFNGLNNYFTVRIAQAYVKDMVNLQQIDAKAIFFYNILNVGFGIFSLVLIIVVSIFILSGAN